jgi:hypothetical protein
MYGCYRWGDADNSVVLLSAAVKVLCAYPESVVRKVCDPLEGLPFKMANPPSIYHIGDECERKMKPLREAEEARRRANAAEAAAKAPGRAPLTEEEIAARKAFMARWREDHALAAARVAAESGQPLYEMDSRKCQGELRELVRKATLDRVRELSAEYALSDDEEVRLSARSLVRMGVDPLGRGLGNNLYGPYDDRID